MDYGVLNCLELHFRQHDVIRIRLSKQWRHCTAEIAQQVEEKANCVVLERSGRSLIVFRYEKKNKIKGSTSETEVIRMRTCLDVRRTTKTLGGISFHKQTRNKSTLLME